MHQRVDTKVRADTHAECSNRFRTLPVQIWDLSAGDCQFQYFAGKLIEEDRLAMSFQTGTTLPGVGAWQDTDFAGLRFIKPQQKAAMRDLGVTKPESAGWFEIPSLPHPLRNMPSIL